MESPNNKPGQTFSEETIREADSAYRPFPTFSLWSGHYVDVDRWNTYAARLRQHAEASPETLRRAQDYVKRAAAYETGVIEDLYEVDRGFTFTAAKESMLWEAAISQKEERTRSIIQAQLRAYDCVLDFATRRAPIAEAFIRELHSVICEGQEVHLARTPFGNQEQALPLGQYKTMPNHVLLSNGSVHSYAPVEATSSEMHRLCQELNSEEFTNSHSILQASYIHYALVAIHPFTDGNGRVARALASIFTYRSDSIPLLITDDSKRDYFDSLAAADHGDFQPFINFIFSRGIDSMRLIEESIKAASLPPITEVRSLIAQLYTTKGGYEHAEVDQAGYRFFDL